MNAIKNWIDQVLSSKFVVDILIPPRAITPPPMDEKLFEIEIAVKQSQGQQCEAIKHREYLFNLVTELLRLQKEDMQGYGRSNGSR